MITRFFYIFFSDDFGRIFKNKCDYTIILVANTAAAHTHNFQRNIFAKIKLCFDTKKFKIIKFVISFFQKKRIFFNCSIY